jgi:tetratricopeptide (TPR) repeat protein
MRLFNLSQLYHILNPTINIHKAIQIKRDAVALTDDGHNHKPARLNTLTNSLIRRYELYGDVADIDEAIFTQERAARLTPDDDYHKAGCLYVLGNAYRLRFRRLLGGVADIERAVDLGERSVALSARSDDAEKAMFLDALGDSRRGRFECSGSLSDIDAAINAHELSVQITPSDSMHLGHRLMDLGTSLQIRFSHLHENQDIDRAISVQQKGFKLLERSSVQDKASQLNNLANSFQSRFERFKTPSDISSAVTHHESAVALIPDSHPNKHLYLSSLGNSLLLRFDHSSERADIDKAVEVQRHALSLMPDDHATKTSCLNNLAIALLRRSSGYNRPEDIDESIQALEKAVSLIPTNHPNRPSNLFNLAGAFKARFDKFQHVEDIKRAVAIFTEAAQSPTGPPSIRFDAAAQWGIYAGNAGLSPLDGFRCALDLLPRVAWMGMSVFDQRVEIYRTGSIVHAAAEAAIEAGEYATAVEWLEQGRLLVWSHTLQLRAPVDELRDKHPELAKRLVQVSKALELASARDEKTADESAIRNHHDLTHQWEALVDEVRDHAEFKDFLRPKRFAEFVTAASSGPVIVINVARRCDALIVMHDTTDKPLHVPLTGLTNDRVASLERSMRNLLVGAGIQSAAIGPVGATRRIGFAWSDSPDFRFQTLLAELWNLVAKPVLDRLVSLRSSHCTFFIISF